MEIKTTKIDGILEIQPKVFKDDRGFFVETWQQNRYEQLEIGPFVQDNHSFSTQGVLRGMHFQKKHPQGKLISAIEGEIFDVAVDLRRNSPTFLQWHSVVLSGEKANQIWVPEGFAHGFLTLSPKAHIIYKCTDFYYPNDEETIHYLDPDIGIIWPSFKQIILSPKDSGAKRIKQITP